MGLFMNGVAYLDAQQYLYQTPSSLTHNMHIHALSPATIARFDNGCPCKLVLTMHTTFLNITSFSSISKHTRGERQTNKGGLVRHTFQKVHSLLSKPRPRPWGLQLEVAYRNP